MRTMVDLGKQRGLHHLQIIDTPTTVDCAREFRHRRTLRSLIECMLPYCCTSSPSDHNDAVSVSSSSSSSDHSSSSSSSSSAHSNSVVSGTFFGNRRGRVSFCLQDATAVGSPPLLLLELAVPTAALAKEMDQAGVLRIALECDRRRRSSGDSSSSIFEVPVWSMYCNGRKMGFAVRRKVTENDAVFLRMMQSVSVGAGVVPSDQEQTLYLRARFERVTGSSDSESFHMMNPGGSSHGQELSIFLLRS